jgi:phosphatidyl-myo-inositol dimannoside synthase
LNIVVAHGIEVWQPLGALRRSALRSANVVIGPSNDTVAHVLKVQGVSKDRVHVVPWSLDEEFLASIQGAAPPRPAVFPNGRVILAVGRLAANERYKGFDELLRVMPGVLSAAPDTHLVIVGDGDDRARLQHLCAELGLSSNTIFTGSLERDHLKACYHHCDVFALPSSGEGFGLVFLEAMAHGKPVIGGAHGGTPDVIEDGVTGYLVRQDDGHQLQTRLRQLLTNESARLEMGHSARGRVLRDFTFDRFGLNLSAIVEKQLE